MKYILSTQNVDWNDTRLLSAEELDELVEMLARNWANVEVKITPSP